MVQDERGHVIDRLDMQSNFPWEGYLKLESISLKCEGRSLKGV